ncbi:MAG: glycoside hydrolase family 16 protein [Clostridia bacterium]|nr:glycoside hydrolase family 16 protein [Clostridia bacterium]
MTPKKKKIIIIILAILLALLIVAGSIWLLFTIFDGLPAKRRKKKVVIIKQYPTSDVGTTDDDGYSDDYDDYYESVRRELYQKTQNSVVNYVPEYKITSKKWDGPKGYVIVIPKGDKNSKQFAEKIQKYFKKQAGIELEIVTDSEKEQKKEILIGNTNRYKSKLSENEYAVKISGSKLIFEGGHYVMLGKATDWFVTAKYAEGKVNCLTGQTKDFAATKAGGYKYVWGDEFSGLEINNKKWTFANRMAGSALLETRTDEKVASVSQDNLQLRAIRSYRKENPVAQYATMQSLNTMKTMSFMHGYLEMSARVPFISGAWPSLWANSNGALNNTKTDPYTIEVDIFEVFSSVDKLVPNIHKWRGQNTPSQYNTDHIVNGERVPATPYIFENTDNLTNEYHIYGFKWTEKEMTMSVDGKDYMTFDLTKDFDNQDGMDGFKVPISILINNHMFAPDVELINDASNVNNLDLPYEYDIDWIRLYQIPGKGELNLAD